MCIFYGSDRELDKVHALHMKDIPNVFLFQVEGAGHYPARAMRAEGQLSFTYNKYSYPGGRH